jgi:PAS domain S-box-containing protein
VSPDRERATREQRFRAVFDSALDAMLVADDGARVIDANPAAHTLFGIDGVEMGRLGLSDILEPHLVEAIWAAFRDGGRSTGETTIRRPATEETREAEFSATARIYPGGHLIALRDVTERNHAEAERLVLEERLNRIGRMETVGQFAGGIAHDFNNLLGIILNYAEFAAAAEDLQQAREDIGEVRGAAIRARDLTRQLLLFSRGNQAQAEVFDLVRLVRDSSRLADRLLGSTISVRTGLPEEPVLVDADPSQIDQVLMNLVVNARDAMPEGGTLSLEVSTTERCAELLIGDSGVGMPEVIADRAFEPFFTTKARGSGTGLGLAMVYGIVSRAGGDVSLESVEGDGTKVRVRLPLARDGAEPAHAEEAAGVPEGGGRTVLVVEDDDAVRRLTERLLAEAGYAATAVDRGAEAYELLRWQRFDLLLTDVVMPGMSGLELCRHVEELRPDQAMVVMSGYNERMDTVPDGAEFVRKPFTREALLTALERVWETKRAEHAGTDADAPRSTG